MATATRWWIRGAGSFIAGLLAVIGIPGIADDLKTWHVWGRTISALAPSWAFVGLSITLVLIIWGPSLIGLVRQRHESSMIGTNERRPAPPQAGRIGILQTGKRSKARKNIVRGTGIEQRGDDSEAEENIVE